MHTQQQIESSFDKLVINSHVKSNTTDIENIKSIMENNPDKIWWFPYEFMGGHTIKGNTFFIGYECSARLSELSRNTDLIESRRIGRFKVRRYRFENIKN